VFDLSGKVAIVTGSASGIGRTTAEALAVQGAAVIIADIMGDAAEQTAEEIRQKGHRALAIRVDVAQEADIEAMVAAAVAEYGGLDVLHNNAAAVQSDVLTHDTNIVDLDPELFMLTLRTNVVGCALGAKHAIPHMIARGGGVIINTASAGAHAAQSTRPMYGTSKAAVIQLTKHIATMHGKQNIRSVSVSPGITVTPSVERLVSPEWIAQNVRHNLMPRAGRPEDIGYLVAYLASDEAAFLTGIDIRVDGGMLAHFPAFAEDTDAAEMGAGTRL
jgi:NAD(P)-dependent dehydrogenase (short-subunit alcohol dehydrogenase family)